MKKKWQRIAAYVIWIWIGVSLIGYGLALRNYSVVDRAQTFAEKGEFGGAYHVIEGAVAWVHWGIYDWTDTEFQITGSNLTLVLPRQFISSRANWDNLKSLLVPGKVAWVGYRDRGLLAIEITFNRGSGQRTTPIPHEFIERRLIPRLDDIGDRGNYFLVAGLIWVVLGVIIHRWIGFSTNS